MKEIKEHLTAGGVIYDKGKVAMLRDRWGKLVSAKGHIEKDEDIKDAAKREVSEETGYVNLKLIKQFDKVDFTYNVGSEKHHKVLHQFLFELEDETRDTSLIEDHEIYELIWVDMDEAIKQAAFDNTRELLQNIKKYYSK
ncbi:NUDIX domain-containing protein [Patescibacteria group bacterium]